MKKNSLVVLMNILPMILFSQEFNVFEDVKHRILSYLDSRFDNRGVNYVYDFFPIGEYTDSSRFGVNYRSKAGELHKYFKKGERIDYYTLTGLAIKDTTITFRFTEYVDETFSPRFFFTRAGALTSYFYYEYKYVDARWQFSKEYFE